MSGSVVVVPVNGEYTVKLDDYEFMGWKMGEYFLEDGALTARSAETVTRRGWML